MKVFCKEFITVWTRGLVRWLSRKFDSISIDTSDLAKQGTNPNATNTAILAAFGNIDFSTLAKQGDNPAATNSAILEALSHINPQDPNSKALAQFFGLPEALPSGYEFMQDTEVTDELEDIMQALDPELLQEVEYPEGSGTYMTKAQAITAQAMQIINPSQS